MRAKIGYLLSKVSVIALASLFMVNSVWADNHVETLPGWSTSVGAGAWFFEGDEEVEPGQLYEIKVGKDIDPRWTIEGSFGAMPFLNHNNVENDGRYELEHDTWGLKWGLEALYHFTEEGRWDPFAAAGMGLFWHEEPFESGELDVYAQAGGGLAYYLNTNWSVRGDYRLAMVGHDTEWNHIVLMSAGYHWGGTKRVAGSGAGTLSAEDPAIGALAPVYYSFDSSELDANAQSTLNKNADWLKSNPEVAIVLEGHCDERGTNEYNLALGERRAQSAQKYLTTLGVASERLSTISYGEEWPADPGHNEAAWSKNRRVESKSRK